MHDLEDILNRFFHTEGDSFVAAIVSLPATILDQTRWLQLGLH